MSLFDALLGTAPQIQLGNQASAYGVQGLDFSSPYYQNLRNSNQLQGQQAAFLQAMQQQAQGIGPGQAMADALYRQQVQEGQANIAGQLAANRALNPAARAFLASQAAGKVGANAAAGAAANRAQQQIAAQGMLGSSLGQFRGQDLSAAGMAQQGQLAQEGLKAGAFNAAQNLNAEIGMRQAGMQQAANQNAVQAWGGIANGLGGGIAKLTGLAHGGMVDSPAADVVPAALSPGEIVIPRSIAQGPDAPSHAAAFMQGVLAQEQARAKALHGHFGFADGGPVETPRVWPSERERLAGVTDAEVEAKNAQAAADEAARAAEIAKQRAYTQWAQTGEGPKPDRSSSAPIAPDAGLMAPMTPSFKAQALTGQVPSSPNPPAQEPAGRVPGAAPANTAVAPADRQTRLAQGFEAASESPVERAVRENSEIEARTAEKTAQTYENQIAQRDAALAQRKQEVEKNLADYKRIAETAPDPHKWWSEQSTGGKIATGIGLMLSSLGSGITGQPNVAMQVIDDAIKRDITLQQSKKDSLLAHFEREGKTREEAFALSQSVALQKTADQMQALAARATSQQAANNLILLSRQMAMQSQQLQMGIAEKSAEIGLKRAEAYKAGSEAQKTGMEARKMGLEMGALKALTSGQPTDRQTLNWLPAEYRERVAEVTLPDGKRHMGLVATPKMREELDTQSVAYNNFRDIWKEATEFARQHPGGELVGDAEKKGEEIKNNLIMRLAEVNKAKFSNLSQTDQKMIEDLTANLSKVVDWRNNMRNLNDMKARVDRAWANDLHQAFGTKPATPSTARKYE